MLVPHDMLLMLFYYSTASAPNIKAQQGQKLVVERHSNAHVFDSYFYVVNDRFHLSSPPFKPIFYTMRRVAPISSAVAASRALIERPYSHSHDERHDDTGKELSEKPLLKTKGLYNEFL